ncbi:hypothetical protein EIP86_010317 [Pleurotus ostreatoroseus]|nr:hypothetical protein EIP86_010317 [Pleurotus ostreatoroseus]
MLALAPTPIQQHPASIQFHAHHPSPSATRPPRSAQARPASSSAPPSSSSSSATVSAPAPVRSSHREGPSSPPRSAPPAPTPAHTHPAPPRANGDVAHASTHASALAPPDTDPAAPHAHAGPVDIHAYDAQELLRLLASLLAQIATTNDGLAPRDPHLAPALSPPAPPSPVLAPHHPPIWRTLTTASRNALSSNTALTFHARNVPTISLEAYLLRILKYCPASNEVFLSLLVYFDRMSKLAKEACGKDFVIDSYNIHRLVIAGVTVASKFFSDVFYTNSRYAKVCRLSFLVRMRRLTHARAQVGGLPQAELNQLELQFLLLNDFQLMISKEEMQRYAEQLIHFSYTQQQQDRRSQTQTQTQDAHPSSQAQSQPQTHAHTQHTQHTHHAPLPTVFTPPAAPHGPSGPAMFMSAVEGYRSGGAAYDTLSRSQSHSQKETQAFARQASGAGNRTPQMHAARGVSQAQADVHAGYQGQGAGYAYDASSGYASAQSQSQPYSQPLSHSQSQSQSQSQSYDEHEHARTAYRRSSSAYSTSTVSEASEAETDFEGSTDDEPTIRADVASVRSMSVEGDEDEDGQDAEDGEGDGMSVRSGDGDDGDGVGGEGAHGREGRRERARGRERSGREGEGDWRMMSP